MRGMRAVVAAEHMGVRSWFLTPMAYRHVSEVEKASATVRARSVLCRNVPMQRDARFLTLGLPFDGPTWTQ